MEIRIAGYLAASYLLQQEPAKWDALVILDSTISASDFVRRQALRHRYLRFDDIQQSEPDRVVATPESIEKGLDFARGSGRLLVSCRAGQSRSAAMAYLIACRENGVESAVQLINPTRHVPSPLIIRLGATLMEMPDALEAFDTWQSKNRHISLSDYYDELDEEYDRLCEMGADNLIEE